MLLTNSPSIRDIILFPTMKPEGKEKAAKKEPRVLDQKKIEIEPFFWK